MAAWQALESEVAAINQSGDINGRFVLAGAGLADSVKPLKLGTYGIISGAKAYLIGLLDQQEKDALTFGELFEQLILKATDLGLDTCWLGGTFRKSDLFQSIEIGDREMIAMISPLGYRKGNKRIFESAMRVVIGADRRKPWSELFFNENQSTPLDSVVAGQYAVPLEMVRLGPSASNKQPWRVILSQGSYHFYLQRTPGYGLPGFDIQMNDIGIAKCHFELSAQEADLNGEWQILADLEVPSGWTYACSWMPSVQS